jgi:hypothetical protein
MDDRKRRALVVAVEPGPENVVTHHYEGGRLLQEIPVQRAAYPQADLYVVCAWPRLQLLAQPQPGFGPG